MKLINNATNIDTTWYSQQYDSAFTPLHRYFEDVNSARLAITSVSNTKYNLLLALAMHRSGLFSGVCRSPASSPPSLEDMVSKPPQVVTQSNVARMRIWLGLKYLDGEPVFSKATLVTKPGRVVSTGIHKLGDLAQGFDSELSRGGTVGGLNVGELLFLGTACGILEVREALSRKVGGILLCRVS
ncbi:hypothetical protein L249_4251 [Ophiocordyceps polyrhachis-furcata BCC 54312]|uniref:Ribosomal protein S8 n=1 Tax=Ophiocordyceps polyrhachis-furcata BCC 54312 TaxID=1330021 RepID=A0A367L7H3_9HYPO|nr:hypothetical protein L249_4251 [Ophiocordyceps polyrhachis-furcata BCC 54312]